MTGHCSKCGEQGSHDCIMASNLTIDKPQGYLKSQHVVLKEVYPEMTRNERRKFVTENVPKDCQSEYSETAQGGSLHKPKE